MSELPSEFKKRILDLHGANGQEWLEELPSLIRTIEKSWDIEVTTTHKSLTYNYVAFAENGEDKKAILKIGFPSTALDREAKCLEIYNGSGAARLLKYNSELGALLIERIEPGYDLENIDEQKAIQAFLSVIKEMHRPVKTILDFPTIQDWGVSFKHLRDQFDGESGPLPSDLVNDAEMIYKNLAESMSAPVLLHGDLHHENILAGTREPWLVIDPKGVIGEPEYEIGAFLRNPMSKLVFEDNLADLLKDRIDMISEMTGYDKKRIAQWGFAQAVLSAIWSFEDHRSGWENALEIARTIKKNIYSA